MRHAERTGRGCAGSSWRRWDAMRVDGAQGRRMVIGVRETHGR